MIIYNSVVLIKVEETDIVNGTVKIPENVMGIADSAFKDCTSLTNIEIPEGVKSIGGDAFAGCTSLTNIKIPKGVKHIWRI